MTKFITTTESTAIHEYNLETAHKNILPCNNKHLKHDMYKISTVFNQQPNDI